MPPFPGKKKIIISPFLLTLSNPRDDFGSKCNAELLANLGNLVNRTSKFLVSKLGGRIGPVLPIDDPAMAALVAKVDTHLAAYIQAMDSIHIRAGLREAMAISAAANAFLTEAKLDAKLLSADPERCRAVLSSALNLVYMLSALLEPFLPSVAQDIQRILAAPARRIPFEGHWDPTQGLLDGHQIGQPFHLFHKLDDSFLAELRVRYAGKQ
jgi:methionyl-tRNA synthetase